MPWTWLTSRNSWDFLEFGADKIMTNLKDGVDMATVCSEDGVLQQPG